MKRRVRIDLRFAISGLLALVAAFAVMALTRPVDRIPTLVAAAPLPPGIPLQELPIEVRPIEPLAGVVRAEEQPDVAGRSLLVPLEEGSPIMWSVIAPSGASSVSDALGITLARDNAVQGNLRPGDVVDIYLSDEQGTRRIAEQVIVLDSDAGGGGLAGTEVAVLLAVDSDLAEQVIAGTHGGSIDLVRRGR